MCGRGGEGEGGVRIECRGRAQRLGELAGTGGGGRGFTLNTPLLQ